MESNSGPLSQHQKAAAFLALHKPGNGILILPNAWDVASARVFAISGFPAIGTTSSGVAIAHGYPDGQKISRDEMIAAVGAIARGVSAPVSADVEGGYGRSPEAAGETARAALAAGAVGINLEDGDHDSPDALLDLSLQVERIKAAREAGRAMGVHLVINARTDIFLLRNANDRTDIAVRRANAYREAGADCLFPIGARDADTIASLAREIAGPINILAMPGVPPIPELRRLGVARLSVGGGPMRATLGLVKRAAEELLGPGTYSSFLENTLSSSDMKKILERLA
jgi:2-methylisocitrate lyase-like PEP mutase family enzyme